MGLRTLGSARQARKALGPMADQFAAAANDHTCAAIHVLGNIASNVPVNIQDDVYVVLAVGLHDIEVSRTTRRRGFPVLHADTNRTISFDAQFAAPTVNTTVITLTLEMASRNKVLVAGRVQDAG